MTVFTAHFIYKHKYYRTLHSKLQPTLYINGPFIIWQSTEMQAQTFEYLLSYYLKVTLMPEECIKCQVSSTKVKVVQKDFMKLFRDKLKKITMLSREQQTVSSQY